MVVTVWAVFEHISVIRNQSNPCNNLWYFGEPKTNIGLDWSGYPDLDPNCHLYIGCDGWVHYSVHHRVFQSKFMGDTGGVAVFLNQSKGKKGIFSAHQRLLAISVLSSGYVAICMCVCNNLHLNSFCIDMCMLCMYYVYRCVYVYIEVLCWLILNFF